MLKRIKPTLAIGGYISLAVSVFLFTQTADLIKSREVLTVMRINETCQIMQEPQTPGEMAATLVGY